MLAVMDVGDPLGAPYMTEESATVLEKLNAHEEAKWEHVKPKLFTDLCDAGDAMISPLERSQLTAALSRDPRVLGILQPKHREGDTQSALPRGTTFVVPSSMSVFDAAPYLDERAFTVIGAQDLNVALNSARRAGNPVIQSLDANSRRASDIRNAVYSEPSIGLEQSPVHTAGPVAYDSDEIRDKKVWEASFGPHGRVAILERKDGDGRVHYTALSHYTPSSQVKALRKLILSEPSRFSRIPMTRFLDLAPVKTLRDLSRRNAQRMMTVVLSYISTEGDTPVVLGKSGRPDVFGFRTARDVAATQDSGIPLSVFDTENWLGVPGEVSANRFSLPMQNFFSNALGKKPEEDYTVLYNGSYSPHQNYGKDKVLYVPVSRDSGYRRYYLPSSNASTPAYNNVYLGVLPAGISRRNYGVKNVVRGDSLASAGDTSVHNDVRDFYVNLKSNARAGPDAVSVSDFRNRQNAYASPGAQTLAERDQKFGLSNHTVEIASPYFVVQSNHNADEEKYAKAMQGSTTLEF